MHIRTAVNADLPSIAALHKAQFSTHFLGKYSETLLQRYYESFLGSCVLLVSIHEADKTINGFVLGGKSAELARSKRRFIARHAIRCFFETLHKPPLYKRAFSRIKSLVRLNKIASSREDSEVRLLSIAVSERAKGNGIASELLNRFENEHRTINYGLSVKQENERAIKFYYKHGFELFDERNGTLYLVKSLVPAEALA